MATLSHAGERKREQNARCCGVVEQFRKLYATRRKSYSKASLKVQTGSRTVETIAAEIAKDAGPEDKSRYAPNKEKSSEV